VSVERSDINEFSTLAALMAVPEVNERLSGANAGSSGTVEADWIEDMHTGRLELPAQIGNGRDTASFHSGSNLNLRVA
jgi:hypothetical protein